jgi:hypothetical protein
MCRMKFWRGTDLTAFIHDPETGERQKFLISHPQDLDRVESKYSCGSLIELEQSAEALMTLDATWMS